MAPTMLPSRVEFCHRTFCILCFVTLCGAVLRLLNLGASSLWMDEALSWRLQSFPVWQLIERAADRSNCHPPFYFLVLKSWTTVWGNSDFVLRLPSCLAGTLLIPLMYLWGAELFLWTRPQDSSAAASREVGLLAAGLTACNPLQVHLSQQVRGYSLTALLAVASACLLLKSLRSSHHNRSLWAAWALTATVLCYTHHFGALTIVAEIFFAVVVILFDRRGDRFGGDAAPRSRLQEAITLSIAAAFVACLYLPWLTFAMTQAAALGESFRLKTTWTSVGAAIYGALVGDDTQRPTTKLETSSIALSFLLGLHIVSAIKDRFAGLFLVLWSLLPLAFLIEFSFSFSRSVILTRYLFLCQLSWWPMIALFLYSFSAKRLRIVSGALAVAIIAFNLTTTTQQIFKERRPGMRGAIAYLLSQAKPDEPILAISPQVFLTAKPYLVQANRLRLASDTLDRRRHSGASLLLDSDLVAPEWPSTAGARSFWVIHSDSYRGLAKEDLTSLLERSVSDYQRTTTTWPPDYWWEKPIIIEHVIPRG